MGQAGIRVDKAIKVLMLSPHPSIPGGVVHFVELLKKHLDSAAQIETFIIGRRPQERGAVRAMARLAGDAARLAARAASNRYAVIHLNPSLTEKSLLRDGLLLLILRFLGHGRILIFFHGWRPALEQRILSRRIYRLSFRWLIGRDSYVIVLAQSFRDFLVALGIDRNQVRVFRTMFDGSEIGTQRSSTTGPGRQIVLFMSRLEKKKGVYELMDAFVRIKDKFPRAELVMAGGGPAYHDLQCRVKELQLGDRVTILEYLRGSAKTDLLAQAKIFTLPSYYGEGMPIALLEAMAAGNAILTSRVGGIPEVVRDPDNGILLDKVSVASIETGLTRLLEDAAYCAQVGKTNRETAWENFEAGPVTRDMMRLYEDLAMAEATGRSVSMSERESS